ncbi:GerW family sporulation protein [Desulfolucanica intricata]|uniref:GerW family sporulation protein n=1 Tax=Desulfolucanica intricata TaxID=1285191 RepID=UPI0009EE7D2F|nr:GerW family sporulation protein [Desulfolucanica intricata]
MGEQQHPIEGLMKTAMESIKEMVDVNTVVGDPVESPDGSVIIPISRVACGFAAGGGEFEIGSGDEKNEQQMPAFGGGSGAGVSVQPVGFLVVGQGQVRLLPVDGNAIYDRIIDMAPQLINQIQSMLDRKRNNSKQTTIIT